MTKVRTFSLLLLCATLLHAEPSVPLAMRAIEGDQKAIAELRRLGPRGVDALFDVRPAVPEERFRTVIDQVCRQRDCAWSRLYWYTDIEEAKRVALATKRPILSLRLLGNLDEELSCANSRFFRTMLYSNAAVSGYLRENYILHWQSVRPVPVVTIEMGDGRRMVRTVTGNSIHYLVDAEGRPFDALPGLYSPQAFLAALREGRTVSRNRLPSGGSNPSPAKNVLPAEAAAALAVTKSVVEGPVVDRIALDARRTSIVGSAPDGWGAGEVIFDASSVDLIRTKRGDAHGSLDAVLDNLRRAVAADTRLNETRLRPLIRNLIDGGTVSSLEALNERVYREVFLTPPDDAWMGLTSDAAFTAIDGEGLIEPRVAAKLPAR